MTTSWTSSTRGADASFSTQGPGAGFEAMLGTMMNGMIEDFLDNADLPPGAVIEFELAVRRRETAFG